MWVYIKSEPGLYTVGFYSPEGKWHADSDYSDREEAVARVRHLNGGADAPPKRKSLDVDGLNRLIEKLDGGDASATLPIEQVRAELDAAGIDVRPAAEKVRNALARKELAEVRDTLLAALEDVVANHATDGTLMWAKAESAIRDGRESRKKWR
jgi:hypothetical protein